ncbi:SCO2525 family SAM-dependent methyltransferase [Actinoplanes sp. CA-054009]
MTATDPALSPEVQLVGNGDVDWDSFDSQAYFSHNYRELRDDDARIIQIVGDFFARTMTPRSRGMDRAIDVGSGTNLYPSLTMLPHAARITLFERAFTNREWLQTELRRPHGSWRQFWDAITAGQPAYRVINEPLDVLHVRADVARGNVFALSPDQYDIGTMFFVAESITTRSDEFQRATRKFVSALKSGAPFAAAFMRNSSGYFVGDRHFPACSVDRWDVARALAPVARNVDIQEVESNDLRDGYCGMLVATGRKK